MKLKKITQERLDAIQKESCGQIKFKTVDGTVTEIIFPSPIGDVFVTVGSYTVTVNELATKDMFYLGWFAKVADQTIFLEKTFDDERSREDYIYEFLGSVNRDELVIKTKSVVQDD